MAASPIPITVCHPSIAVATAPMSTGALPPIAKRPVKTRAAAGTLTSAPTAAAGATSPIREGSRRRRTTKTAQPTATVTMPIRVMLVPSAVTPPSAISSPCTTSTTARHSTAVQGPTSTAASAPPIRCPLVPAPTGKLIIWAANTKVATRPAIGAVRSSSSRRAPRSDTATAAAATTPVATEVGASRKPSGTCTSAPDQVGLVGCLVAGTDPPIPRRHPTTLLQPRCNNHPSPSTDR